MVAAVAGAVVGALGLSAAERKFEARKEERARKDREWKKKWGADEERRR